MLFNIKNKDIKQIFSDLYEKKFNRKCHDNISQAFIMSCLKFRFLSDIFDEITEKIIENIFEDKDQGKYIYPCDVIELRQILTDRKITSNNNVVLFGSKTAKKYLNRYPIWIYIDAKYVKDNECAYDFNGMIVSLDNELDFDSYPGERCITDLVVKEPLDDGTKYIISNILLDVKLDFEVSFSNSIPGISSINPKLSKDQSIIKESQDITKQYVYDQVNMNPKDEDMGNPLGLEVGDRVRWRNRGLLLKPRYGKVVGIKNNWVFVEWPKDEGKEAITKFPLGNPALVWKYLARAEE